MADTFSAQKVENYSPATLHFAVTTNDVTPLAILPRAIFCLTAGNLVVKDPLGTTVTYPMVAGDVLPLRAYIVTTATTGTYAGWY